MMERLAFGFGTRATRTRSEVSRLNADAGHRRSGRSDAGQRCRSCAAESAAAAENAATGPISGLMIFTALLFFRPQDQITPLRMLPLAEIAALVALAAHGRRAGSAGDCRLSRITPELLGVVALGGVHPGDGAVLDLAGRRDRDLHRPLRQGPADLRADGEHADLARTRIEQFTWLIVIAIGYIAVRAVFDYARGINLVENGRVQGAVGGMFKNPNDLALNMVAVLPLAALFVVRADRAVQARVCGARRDC